MKALVSVIMPAYNAEKYIEESINSVISQTYKNWELIIINDGSVDNTENIINAYKAADERIKLINQPNKRLGAARNVGIQKAKGEWIAFLDADDLWINTKLEKQIDVACNEPAVSVIYTDGYIFFDEDKNSLSPYPTKTGKFSGEQMYKLEYEVNYIAVASVLVKSCLLKEIGLQEERIFFYGCEDWDYWLRLAAMGAEFYGLEDKLFLYRRHSNNMSSNDLQMLVAMSNVLVKNYDKKKFTAFETRKIFKQLLTYIVINLLIKKRIKEARFLLKNTFKNVPLFFLKFSYLLAGPLGKLSVRPIQILDKIDTKIYSMLSSHRIKL